MRDFIQHTIETAKYALFVFFAPFRTTWFWLAVMLACVVMFSHAEAGYLWTD
jgi:hypothetical protein